MTTEAANAYTLDLKLKRYRISYEIDAQTGSLVVGKASKEVVDLVLKIVLPAVLVVAVLASATWLHQTAMLGVRLIGAMVAGLLIYLVIGIYSVVRKRKVNQGTKVFSPSGITIIDKTGSKQQYAPSDIRGFAINVISNETPGLADWHLVTTTGESIRLLGLQTEDMHHLRNDLDYLEQYVRQLMGLKKGAAQA